MRAEPSYDGTCEGPAGPAVPPIAVLFGTEELCRDLREPIEDALGAGAVLLRFDRARPRFETFVACRPAVILIDVAMPWHSVRP